VKLRQIFSFLLVSVLLAGCATLSDEYSARGDLLMEQSKWEEAAAAYQSALKGDPFNPALQSKLKAAKGLAASAYEEQGRAALKERNLPLAIEAFKRALMLEPSNPARQAALAQALRYKDAQDRLAIGQKLLKAGRLEDAAEAFVQALELDPDLKAAQDGLVQLAEKQKAMQAPPTGSRQPITLKFQSARTKEVFEVLARSAGINFLFDKDMKDDPVTIFIKDASFEDALHLILTTQNLFMRRVAADTILIVPKTKQKLDQYQDLLIRTFYLSTAKAKDMVNLLRTMLETKRIFVNEDLNAIVMRDSADKVKLAERIILANDRKPGEVLFEIEVLEVDKTKNQTLGTNLAKQAGLGITPPAATPSFPGTGSNAPTLFTYSQLTSLGPASYLFTLPAGALFNFFQSDADTKTLANPKIRVVNNKQAKINIGDKVPILLSTTSTVPGTVPGTVPTQSTITSIEYKDTGVKLTVEPVIHLNNDVTFKLQLEVTALGNLQALGNGQSQFTFSTRTAETTLSLKDGESVVIGGLIQDQDRTTVEKVPGLGDIPVLGEIFKATTKQVNSTEVILTITPRIVRSLELAAADDQAFWSGTEEAYGVKQLFGETGLRAAISATPPGLAPSPPGSQAPRMPASAVLSFLPPDRTIQVGQDVTMDVLVSSVEDLAQGALTVTYDPKVLEFRQAVEGEFLKREGAATVEAAANPETGMVVVRLKRAEGAKGVSGAGVLATLTFAGKGTGSSPVAIQTSRLLSAARAPLAASGGQGTVRVQ
jgi:general secretion pathway protein D